MSQAARTGGGPGRHAGQIGYQYQVMSSRMYLPTPYIPIGTPYGYFFFPLQICVITTGEAVSYMILSSPLPILSPELLTPSVCQGHPSHT